MEVLAQAGLTSKLKAGTEVLLDQNGCAIWPRGKTSGGYGQVRLDGRPQYVHVVVYSKVVDAIPSGWDVDHVYDQGCRSRACFWPSHLEAVTQAENNRRAGSARRQRGPRSCGHSWDDDRNGRSDCAACHREAEAARKAPQKAAYAEFLRVRTEKVRCLDAVGFSRNEIAAEVRCSVETVRRTLLGLMKRY